MRQEHVSLQNVQVSQLYDLIKKVLTRPKIRNNSRREIRKLLEYKGAQGWQR